MITGYGRKKIFERVICASCDGLADSGQAKKEPGARRARTVSVRSRGEALYACAASAFTRAVSRETFREAVFL
jgi:hypothetical protein